MAVAPQISQTATDFQSLELFRKLIRFWSLRLSLWFWVGMGWESLNAHNNNNIKIPPEDLNSPQNAWIQGGHTRGKVNIWTGRDRGAVLEVEPPMRGGWGELGGLRGEGKSKLHKGRGCRSDLSPRRWLSVIWFVTLEVVDCYIKQTKWLKSLYLADESETATTTAATGKTTNITLSGRDLDLMTNQKVSTSSGVGLSINLGKIWRFNPPSLLVVGAANPPCCHYKVQNTKQWLSVCVRVSECACVRACEKNVEN